MRRNKESNKKRRRRKKFCGIWHFCGRSMAATGKSTTNKRPLWPSSPRAADVSCKIRSSSRIDETFAHTSMHAAAAHQTWGRRTAEEKMKEKKCLLTGHCVLRSYILRTWTKYPAGSCCSSHSCTRISTQFTTFPSQIALFIRRKHSQIIKFLFAWLAFVCFVCLYVWVCVYCCVRAHVSLLVGFCFFR